MERDDGEDVQVYHNGKRKDKERARSDSRASKGSRSSREHHDDGIPGPGFPGHRMAEIARMIESGSGMLEKFHHHHDDDGNLAEPHTQHRGQEQGTSHAAHRVEDRPTSPSQAPVRSASPVSERSRAVTTPEPAAVPLTLVESPAGSPSKAQEQATQGEGSRPVKLTSRLSFLGARPLPKRRESTLTAEEKLARDAWCRKERVDRDDRNTPRAWRAGRRMIIERNNGEDVEVVDVDPTEDAQEIAARRPDLNVRSVQPAELRENLKRFNLKAIADRKSFRGMFGQGAAEAAGGPVPSASTAIPSVTVRPAVVAEDPEEIEDESPEAAVIGSSDPVENPNLLSVRKTGIPLQKTETTDSIRWGHLPQPKRRK